MSKREFLEGLRTELEGRVPEQTIRENLDYYDSYIAAETAKGAREEEVVDSLGGPMIIARTIVDAAYNTQDKPDGFEQFGFDPVGGKAAGSGGGSRAGGAFQDENPRRDGGRGPGVHYIDFSKWYVKLAAIAVVIVVLLLVMAVFMGILGLAGALLSVFWPVILIFALYQLFRRRR